MGDLTIDLNAHDGGIENDPGFDTKFEYDHFDVGGVCQNMFHLNVGDAIQIGARLITDYFPMEGRKHGFLVLEYFLDGDGATSLKIIMQDQDDSFIWKGTNKSSDWQRARIYIKSPSDPRFFIEAECDPGNSGVIAIRKLKLKSCCCCHCYISD
jgi:hypothetical protein